MALLTNNIDDLRKIFFEKTNVNKFDKNNFW